jgi:hypothetical protein
LNGEKHEPNDLQRTRARWLGEMGEEDALERARCIFAADSRLKP